MVHELQRLVAETSDRLGLHSTAPNLLLTPHVAGSVLGFGDRFAALLVQQLHRYLHRQPLQNTVTGQY